MPDGIFSVSPSLPPGLNLDQVTGEISGKPSRESSRQDYEVTLQNVKGSAKFVLSLETQLHTEVEMQFAEAWRSGRALHKIIVVGSPMEALAPTVSNCKIDYLLFDVKPELPNGLRIDKKSGQISGTPDRQMGRTVFTVTARNQRPELTKSEQIEFAVAERWQGADPKTWTEDMCLSWLIDIGVEDNLDLFKGIDGQKLIALDNRDAIARQHPSWPKIYQSGLPSLITGAVEKFERLQKEEQEKRAREQGSDAEREALISQIKAAAEKLGLEVQEVNDQDKYDTEKLVMGLPPDAGLGINPFLNYPGGEDALLREAGKGLDAINKEIDTHGTPEEKECRDYVLYHGAGSSDKTFQNGWKRDCDPDTGKVLESRQIPDAQAHGGKRCMCFSDFMDHPITKFCKLTEAQVFALRYYTTAGFKGINWPLRESKRRQQKEPHKLAVLVFILAGAIKKLRAWAGKAANAQDPADLFRGMSQREIFDEFMKQGGTELALMSTTAELWVALKYTVGHKDHINTLLWLRTENFMDRGVDLEWLSAFPHEKEYLYPPLSYLKPLREKPLVLKIGDSTYQVVELKINMS